MKIFKVAIATDNAAFSDSTYALNLELARIFRVISDRCENGEFFGTVHDSNGNRCGEYRLEETSGTGAESDAAGFPDPRVRDCRECGRTGTAREFAYHGAVHYFRCRECGVGFGIWDSEYMNLDAEPDDEMAEL